MRRKFKKEFFAEKGRVDCTEISALPGVLDEIALDSFRARFQKPIFIEEDKEYNVRLTFFPRNSVRELLLFCFPQDETDCGEEIEVEFKILRSPDSPELMDIIGDFRKKISEESDVTDMIIPAEAEFVQ
jgi:hypothetical protein